MTEQQTLNRSLRSNRFCLLAAILEQAVFDINDRRVNTSNRAITRAVMRRRREDAIYYLRNFRNEKVFEIAAELGMTIPNPVTVERNIQKRLKNNKSRKDYTAACYSLKERYSVAS